MRLFRWVIDDEGDIGLQVCGSITLIKYKDSTIVYWPWHGVSFYDAPRRIEILRRTERVT